MRKDDLDDYLSEEPNKSYNIITLLAIFCVAAALIATAWYIYDSYKNKNDDEIIVITADHDEIKSKPSDPGGMVVDNMDKAVYDAIDGSHKDEAKIEIILPPAEEPIDKKNIMAETKAAEAEHLSEEKQIIEATNAEINKSEPQTKEQLQTIEAKKSEITKLENVEKAIEEKVEEYIKPVAQKQAKNKSGVAKKQEKFHKVQVASFKSSNEAEKEWNNLSKRFPKLIGVHKPYVTSKNIEGKGIFYRLQVGPFDSESAAHAACKKFKESGVNCFIVKP